jgi:hypothetical protein
MNDRDVIHSSLSIQSTEQFSDGGVFDNNSLRLGEIQKIIYPKDDDSRSKVFIEYNVYVQQLENGTGAGVLYTNCLLVNLLAGLADEFHYTLRVPKTPSLAELKEKKGLGFGSKVLILCLDGQRTRAYILGGVRDPRDERDKESKDLGHHLNFEFNGIGVFINKDGELTLTYKGKTLIDGKVDAKDEQVGTYFRLDEDGNALLSDKDGKNSLLIDHKNKKVIIKRDEAFELGEATDKMLLGESFRNAQKQKNNKLKSYFKTAKNLLQQAGTQLNTAGGAVAGPFMAAAAGPSMIAAAQLIIQVSTMMEQMGQAIGDFEDSASQKESFLSKRNKAD